MKQCAPREDGDAGDDHRAEAQTKQHVASPERCCATAASCRISCRRKTTADRHSVEACARVFVDIGIGGVIHPTDGSEEDEFRATSGERLARSIEEMERIVEGVDSVDGAVVPNPTHHDGGEHRNPQEGQNGQNHGGWHGGSPLRSLRATYLREGKMWWILSAARGPQSVRLWWSR